MKAVMTYFAMNAADFAREWKQLTPQDKDDLKTGTADGSLTY